MNFLLILCRSLTDIFGRYDKFDTKLLISQFYLQFTDVEARSSQAFIHKLHKLFEGLGCQTMTTLRRDLQASLQVWLSVKYVSLPSNSEQ